MANVNQGRNEAENPDEVVRRLRWAFAAAGVRFIKTEPTTGARMKTDGKAWGMIVEDLTALGYKVQALLAEPPYRMHLRAAIQALEAVDLEKCWFHLQRLAVADNPTAAQELPQHLHLLVPIGAGGWGGGLFPAGGVEAVAGRLKVTAKGTVIKGDRKA